MKKTPKERFVMVSFITFLDNKPSQAVSFLCNFLTSSQNAAFHPSPSPAKSASLPLLGIIHTVTPLLSCKRIRDPVDLPLRPCLSYVTLQSGVFSSDRFSNFRTSKLFSSGAHPLCFPVQPGCVTVSTGLSWLYFNIRTYLVGLCKYDRVALTEELSHY